MLKYLVIVAACWMQSSAAIGETDTVLQSLSSSRHVVCNQSNTVQQEGKPSVVMNGNTNYHAAQQIFYIYGPTELKKSLPERKEPSKTNSGYTVTPGIGAHKLYTQNNNWNNARKSCVAEGAHLAIINSEAEEKVLIKMMTDKSVGAAWVGMHDLYQEGDWTTVLDQSLQATGFSKWAKGQPDNWQGNQNCGALTSGGGFDDGTCSGSLAFICKLPISPEELPEAN